MFKMSQRLATLQGIVRVNDGLSGILVRNAAKVGLAKHQIRYEP